MAELILQGSFERFGLGKITIYQVPMVRVYAFNPVIPDYQDKVSVGFGDMYPLQFTKGRESMYVAAPRTVLLSHSDAINFRSGRVYLDTGGAFLVGSLTKFSIKPAVALDPEYLYVQHPTADNSGVVDGPWTRHSALFALPKTARYLGVGGKFNDMAPGGAQHIKDVQVEYAPVDGSDAPTVFTPARSVYTRIGPDRLNYSLNPAFANDTLNWTNITRTPSGERFVGVRSVSAGGADEVTHTVTDLDPGKLYVMSLTITSSRNLLATPYIIEGGDTYRGDPIEAVGGDRRLAISFTATASTVTIGILLTATEASVVTMKDTMIEVGDTPGEYFDGSFGEDYLWEVGGIPGNSRSYYYKGRIDKHAMIKRILSTNIPLGIGIAEPQFGVLPTQAPQ